MTVQNCHLFVSFIYKLSPLQSSLRYILSPSGFPVPYEDWDSGTRNVSTSTKEANAGDDGRTVDEAVPAGRTSTTLTIRPQPLPQAQPDPGMLELLTSSENHARVLEARAVAVRKPAALHTPAEPTTTQVCWGKITTKKHKTWEGDGTLTIVGGKSVTLGDEDGKVIGSSGLVKGEELEEGSRLSKEVELVERIDGEVAKENDVPVKRVRFEARGGFRPPAESMCAGSPIVVSSWLGLWGGSDCGGLCSIDDAGAFVRSVEV